MRFKVRKRPQTNTSNKEPLYETPNHTNNQLNTYNPQTLSKSSSISNDQMYRMLLKKEALKIVHINIYATRQHSDKSWKQIRVRTYGFCRKRRLERERGGSSSSLEIGRNEYQGFFFLVCEHKLKDVPCVTKYNVLCLIFHPCNQYI